MSEFTLRDVRLSDAAEIAAIYAHYVAKTTATFEETPPDSAEIARRITAVRAQDYPWRVMIRGGEPGEAVGETGGETVGETGAEIVGYAYVNAYKPRSAYRFTVENSVYIAPGHHGQGLGRILLQDIIDTCRQAGFRQMIAVIADSNNARSQGLHRALGFEPIGTAKAIGWKFGRAIDVTYMQCDLAGPD